ncbi:MAG: hypothetical protein RL708_1850 [Bacteroidota bacterium]|jgi:hypothetical protein
MRKIVAILFIVLIAGNVYSQDTIPKRRHSVFVSLNPLLLQKISATYNIRFFDDYFNYSINLAYRQGMYYQVPREGLVNSPSYINGYYYTIGNGLYFCFNNDFAEKRTTLFFTGLLFDYRKMQGIDRLELKKGQWVVDENYTMGSKINIERISEFISSKVRIKASENFLVELQLDFGFKTEKITEETINNKTLLHSINKLQTISLASNFLVSVGYKF